MLCSATAAKEKVSLSLAASEYCLVLDLADPSTCVEMSCAGLYMGTLQLHTGGPDRAEQEASRAVGCRATISAHCWPYNAQSSSFLFVERQQKIGRA